VRAALATLAALASGVLIGAAAMSLHQPGTAGAAPGKGNGKAHPAAPAYVPSCPRPVYSANGNVSPLFCQIDNPVALQFYERLAPRLFALGPNATPQQVGAALTASVTFRHATNMEVCAAYQLAAWWKQWKFDVDPSQPYCG
jgi:hypothetical protein